MSSSSHDPDEARRQRALERRGRVTLRRTTLEAPDDDPPIVGPEAIELVAHLSRAAWSMTGRPMPQYSRRDLPYRFVRHSATRA